MTFPPTLTKTNHTQNSSCCKGDHPTSTAKASSRKEAVRLGWVSADLLSSLGHLRLAQIIRIADPGLLPAPAHTASTGNRAYLTTTHVLGTQKENLQAPKDKEAVLWHQLLKVKSLISRL